MGQHVAYMCANCIHLWRTGGCVLKVAFKESFISTYAFSSARSTVGETGWICSSSYCDKWLFRILKVYLMTPRCQVYIPHAALNTILTLWTWGFLERIPPACEIHLLCQNCVVEWTSLWKSCLYQGFGNGLWKDTFKSHLPSSNDHDL